MSKKSKSKFYIFNQNNSGGRFTKPAIYLLIEADSYSAANLIACSEFGVYFDSDNDCPCCGSRWTMLSEFSENYATTKPLIYGSTIEDYIKENNLYRNFATDDGIHVAVVRYKNGKIVNYSA